MPNLAQPWFFRGINSPQSTGNPSSDNMAEKACELQPLNSNHHAQANYTEHIAGEEEERSALTVTTVSGCPDEEGDPQLTASVVKNQFVVTAIAPFSQLITSAKMVCPKRSPYLANITLATILELTTCVISVMGLELAACCGTCPHSSLFWSCCCLIFPIFPQASITLKMALQYTIAASRISCISTMHLSPVIDSASPNIFLCKQPPFIRLCAFLTNNSPFPSHDFPRRIYLDYPRYRRALEKFETHMLKHTLKYFATIYQTPESWPKPRTGIVKLDGVDLATMEVYNYWLKTSCIEETDTLVPDFALPLKADRTFSQRQNKLRPVLIANQTKTYGKPIKTDRLDQLVQCWIFTDYIEAPAF